MCLGTDLLRELEVVETCADQTLIKNIFQHNITYYWEWVISIASMTEDA